MQRHLFSIFILLFIVACTSNTIYKEPDDLIPEDMMVDLIVDIQLASAAKSSKNKNGKYGVDYMPLVYEKYKIDSAQFARSSFYYATDIDVETKLLRKVEAKIRAMGEKTIEALRISDSIENMEKDALKKKQDSSKVMVADSLIL